MATSGGLMIGVNLAQVPGHGFKERITQEDVKAFVKGTLATPAANTSAAAVPSAGAGSSAGASAAAPARPAASPGGTPAAARAPAPASTPAPSVPAVDYAQFGPTALEPLSRIQRISGPRLQASWSTIPHVTQFDEADITELEQLRASLKDRAQAAGVKLTPLAFIMRACVKALQEFPRFNSALAPDGANLVVRKYVHMGFAADTPNGLVVPVVRDADRKDVYELARHLGQLSEKARSGKLPPTDMQGGCFTISSLGGIGGTAFTPIINWPEVAILGLSRSRLEPVVRGGQIVPRLSSTSLMRPAAVDGTSIEALSVSSVMSGVSISMRSPGFTSTSTTSTSVKLPMSGIVSSTLTARPRGDCGDQRARGPARW